MKYIISALLITSGLVFVGLSQRYDFHGERYRIDRLTGEMMDCGYDEKAKQNDCDLVVKGTGIFS